MCWTAAFDFDGRRGIVAISFGESPNNVPVAALSGRRPPPRHAVALFGTHVSVESRPYHRHFAWVDTTRRAIRATSKCN